ncbi:MAG: methyltransferase domain-containing protein [Candidatus Omnitrophica bacterium]|nr:methyltransferase domain-containing protein [Candidatus Omnitrophota bacterium]
MPSTIVRELEKPCAACEAFSVCEKIDQDYHEQLIQSGWNYRVLKDADGRRVSSPIRRCSEAFWKLHASTFEGKEVLEIGCGRASLFDSAFIRSHDVRYTGIDPHPRRRGLPPIQSQTIPSKFFNLFIRCLNFPLSFLINLKHKIQPGSRIYYIKDFFPSDKLKRNIYDVIYSSNSIEHWHEKIGGSSSDHQWKSNFNDIEKSVGLYRKDIQICYDLLKPDGVAMFDCPIYLHGNVLFFRAFLDQIRTIFQSVPWNKITYEYWRKDYNGLRAYLPDDFKAACASVYHMEVENIWMLGIVAKKQS